MAAEIFIDSGAWIGLILRDDPYYKAAAAFYPQLIRQWPVWVTTNLVIAETYTLINRTAGHLYGMRFLAKVQKLPRLIKIYSDPVMEAQAEAILRQFADQDFSYVDAVSFAVMQQREISEAFAFDHHFTTAGFTRVV